LLTRKKGLHGTCLGNDERRYEEESVEEREKAVLLEANGEVLEESCKWGLVHG